MNVEKSKAVANANNLASLGLKMILAPIALLIAGATIFFCYVALRAIWG